MEWKEQDVRMFNPSLNQPQAQPVHAEEICPVQDSPPQTTGVVKSTFPCHALTEARPYYSAEYSPGFHKLGSTLPCSIFGTMSHIEANIIPLQASTETHVPYLEKKRLLDKQEEIQEVKQLDEWKPAEDIFTAVLEGLNDKAS